MAQTDSVIYQPAEDSWLLATIVKKKVTGKSVLDMGTGSGIQARTAQHAGAKSVLAVDINRQALQKVREEGIATRYSDLFSNVKEKFDIIICNPPYLPQDMQEDLASARATTGGKEGDEWIIRFLKQADTHLTKKGEILLLLSSLTPRKKMNALLTKKKLEVKVLATQALFMETLEVWSIR
jgi:release factor glutamine methyltransferase